MSQHFQGSSVLQFLAALVFDSKPALAVDLVLSH